MTVQKDQQLFQVQNILETLLEATDHFTGLIKEREFHQSIHTFSSIVEGAQAVIPALIALDEDYIQQTKKLERNLFLISGHLEKGELAKVPEILQFSLRPLFVNLSETFKQLVGNQKEEKLVHIGVFHSWANPREFQPRERTDAMVGESIKQNAVLYFFTSKDIDFDNQQIEADVFQDNGWKRVTAPFPDVIQNIGAGRRSQEERRLSRIVPFTSFHVGNKYTLPKRMVKYRKFAELLVPFKVCRDVNDVYTFIENNNRVVFKALGSNRGENIYFVTKKGSRYVILDQKNERIMSNDSFKQFVEDTVLAEKNSYIIQKYIHTRTKADEPYHFRAHVQKNGDGKWHLTHIYPRIGNKKSNLSNISTEGRVEDFPTFLRQEHGDKQGAKYEKEILQLSIDVAMHLDKLYGLSISELGLDFAIDDTGRIWMHEANNGPQTAYHEEKRAMNIIAYAKYIAQNGIMYTRAQRELGNSQFQAQNSQFPYAELQHDASIGMMTGTKINETLTKALEKTAVQTGLNFFYFRPVDIDFDRELIKAHFLEDNEWVPKVVAYPDVIIDYTKLRGNNDASYIYEELSDIPFTNPWPVQNRNRSGIYGQLQQNEGTAALLPHFEKVERPYDVIRFMRQHDCVLLKPQDTANYKTYAIQYELDKTYTLTEKEKNKRTYNENSLKNYIQELMKENNLIVQADATDSEGNTIKKKLHLMLNADGDWTLINSDEMADNQKAILQQALPLAKHFKSVNTDIVSEMTLTVILDQDRFIQVQEIDPNGTVPGFVTENETAIAKATVNYAQSLI